MLDDRDEAMRLGYRFDALSARYQAMFEVARQALHCRGGGAGLAGTARGRTRAWLARADLRASAALLLLEQAALRHQELLARDELKRRFLGRDADRSADRADALAAVQESCAWRASSAAGGADSGHRLRPAAIRRARNAGAGKSRQATEWRQQSDRLRSEAPRWLPPERQAALDATEANVDAWVSSYVASIGNKAVCSCDERLACYAAAGSATLT